MKGYLATGMGVWILAGVVLTGGCVPQSQYDQAMAGNRKLADHLRDEQAKVQQLEGQVSVLNEQMTQPLCH